MNLFNETSSEAGPGKNPFLTALKEVAFFAAIYLYFAGFIYVYFFYDHFGIPLHVLEIPVHYIFVHSYNLIWHASEIKWALFISKGSIWIWIIALYFLLLLSTTRKWTKHFIYIVFLLALFPFLYSLAKETALIEAGRIRRGETARRIVLVFKADAEIKKLKVLPQESSSQEPTPGQQPTPAVPADAESLALFIKANERDANVELADGRVLPRLYLVTETTDSFYVLYQPRLKDRVFDGHVYEVPRSEVILAHVEISQLKSVK